MFIPLIKKNPDANDFTCRDGEIEYMTGITTSSPETPDSSAGNVEDISSTTGYGVRFALEAASDYPTFVVRIPLESGDAEKVALMLQGQISRVDAASAERITRNIVVKTASEYSGIVIENRRLGLHLLPFRVFALICRPDGSSGFPSPQAIILPSEYPPHPEITASNISDNTLSLSLRIPVIPQRLQILPPPSLPEGYSVKIFVSYPLYIPKTDEMTGSLGSVRSATGGNSTGIRYSFLSSGNLKYSVAAPEKYYQLTGNEKTGYRMASKAAPLPDYTGYAEDFGYVAPFPVDSLRQQGSGIDPLDWIADWEKSGDGYLPLSLPYIYRSVRPEEIVPEGVDATYIESLAKKYGFSCVLLTRPMTLADAENSRRKAEPKGIYSIKVLGLGDSPCIAVLFGSTDGTRYQPLRRFDPHATSLLLSPPRLFHRLLLLSDSPLFSSLSPLALDIQLSNPDKDKT